MTGRVVTALVFAGLLTGLHKLGVAA